ncbi:hypothetical protein BD324DRAFT_618613 [Kockovaella imperatae]|uniref:Ubiquitin-activating enzyme E1-like n=1 Tax=Kockovaella imperatae TaxID=4999 RepID=A0A1Y1UPR4_9TREE|nr:hypothetical protein BD324DRAFT_618613 [Kockovaella imperatae]ORX39135.1 hypothetical protein BD324DRAFT_618613 [Kockovaella imperatae]
MTRLRQTEALLGSKVFQKVRDTPVLVVGAGGIGCELLKNLVLVGFSNIEIIDLDIIDLSNLNRQFLFRKPDISKSKAITAAAAARHFNPSSGIKIHPRHGNVKEGQNDIEWIKGFGLVMNALDNMDARRHVNKLCQAAGVPLIESGTAGYLGQVTPFWRDRTECFDCVTKPTPKTFPVCTIRATPSEPIHCIVWAKSYLFGKLFGEDDEALDTEELDKAQAAGENAEEIEQLKHEAAAFRQVRAQLGEEDGPKRVFEKVFHEDISKLLAMEDMWKVPGRVKPVPLGYDAIVLGDFVAPPLRSGPVAQTNGRPVPERNGESSTSALNANSKQLKDQRELTVKENLDMFIDSCRRLSARMISQPDIVLSFDKDDDDTLDFVLATANLRAIAYGIPTKTRFQVKEMAGNIIPAIATTNAIIAGLIVMQAINLLSSNIDKATNVFLRSDPAKPLGIYKLQPPNPACAVCRDIYVPFKVDVSKCTLGTFVDKVVKEWLPKGLGASNGNANGHAEEDEEINTEEVEWSVYESTRILADPDFNDNYEKTLEELEVVRGKMLTVRDEDDQFRAVHFCIVAPDPNATNTYTLPPSPPGIPRKPKKAIAPADDSDSSPPPQAMDAPAARRTGLTPSEAVSKKRAAGDDDDDGVVTVASDGQDSRKKRKVDAVVDMTGDDDDIELIE